MNSLKLIDVDRVAAILSVSTSNVRKMVFHKRIPFYKIGRLVKFKESEIHEWVKTKSRGVEVK